MILGDLLNNESKEQGLPQVPQAFTGAIAAFIAHACLTDASYVDTAVKAGIVWSLCIREENLLQLVLWKMVHFALFLVKISINFSPSYSTVFFHHSVHLYCTKISKF
jgi:hypothetical protein